VPPFPRVHYDDAAKMLDEGFAAVWYEWAATWARLTKLIFQQGWPVMVHHYPAAVKAFMKRDPNMTT
jgi:asparaginyl-tRNA synthetase